jgi:hypothetical protein
LLQLIQRFKTQNFFIFVSVMILKIPSHCPCLWQLIFFPVHISVAPSLASIDGENPPAAWNETALPWMVQSPLMPEIAVLIALLFRNIHQGIESSKSPNALVMRGGIYSLLKDFLCGDIAVISDGAVHALLLLGSIEVCDSTNESDD